MKIFIASSVQQEAVRQTLRSQLRFYFPEITEVTFESDQIVIETESPIAEDKLTRATTKIVQRFRRLNEEIPQTVLFDSETMDVRTYFSDSAAVSNQSSFYTAARELIERLSAIPKPKANAVIAGSVHPVRKGLNIYSSVSTEVLQSLDRFFKQFFQLEYDAEDVKPPSMISSSVVHRSGYFTTGCQHISFVAPISNDPDVFEQFLPYWNKTVDKQGNGRTEDIYQYTKLPKDILNPAICLHCYPMFEEKQIAGEDLVVMTMSGSVFRDESGNLNNEYRLNEFQMREGIFLGSSERLKPIHQHLTQFFILCGTLFGFQFRIETANDMFFDENAMQQLLSQLISDNKIEMAVYSEKSNKDISIASLNKHHNHFSKNFNITNDAGQPVQTMCMAFGLNRFEYILSEKIEACGIDGLIDTMKQNLSNLEQLHSVFLNDR